MSDDLIFPVEATHILMFARAIDDDNPIYRDAAYAAKTEVGGIIAPPTFPRAVSQFDPDYPMRPKHGKKWFGSGKKPTGLDGPAVAEAIRARRIEAVAAVPKPVPETPAGGKTLDA